MYSTLIMLIVALLALLFVNSRLLKVKNKNSLYKQFILLIVLFCIHLTALILQILFKNTSVQPVYFEYITYIGGMFEPVTLFIMSLTFLKDEKFSRRFNFLYVVSLVLLILLWTNDLHHMFYIKYSINLNETIFGPFLNIFMVYSYILLGLMVVIMSMATIRKSGFLSTQTILILVGLMAPILGNLCGILNIIPTSVYLTPLMFSITSICFFLAIFKYKALNITPVAFKTVINTMSDAFIVISDDGTIADSNKTFKNTFNSIMSIKNEDNLFEILDENKVIDVGKLKEDIVKTREKGDIITKEYHITVENFDKYFEVDIHPIRAAKSKNEYIGTLLLFKDITQHKEDMAELEEKQEIIVKQGQLVSIGELAGGVAHDINTPISAIQTGILMLKEMTSTRTDQEIEILQRMDNCATKIVNIVNSMRNQIRNLGGNTNVRIKVSDVVNDIKVITYHETKKYNAVVNVKINDELYVQGDPTKLGQVLTNLVVNSAQAYKDTKGGNIDITITRAPDNMVMIMVTDYAGGIPDEIAPFVFKNILSTKGNVGTGLGLYLAYSVVKGNFNGEITFDTEKNVGTTFYITIPMA